MKSNGSPRGENRASCSSQDQWRCCAVEGVAGTAAAVVEVRQAGDVLAMPMESTIGAFIAAFDGQAPAVVRVMEGGGGVLVEQRFEAHTL